MFCTKCGMANQDDSTYCRACGAPLATQGPSVKVRAAAYAGFWRRLGASAIDTVAEVAIVAAAVVLGTLSSLPVRAALGGRGASSDTLRTAGHYATSLVLLWLYEAFFVSSTYQATPGKMVLGIVVTDLNGNRLSFSQASARYWSKTISSTLLYLGYVAAGFTERKQALHDLLAGCLVVCK